MLSHVSTNPDVLMPHPHPNLDHKIRPWIDEQIWGHRLWDAQSPWLIFMEFLTVAEACHREGAGRLLNENGSLYPLTFSYRERMFLRNILWNNDYLFQVANELRDSNTAWEKWLEWMQDNAQNLQNAPSRDFTYLRARFRTFHEFASLVATIRSAAIESDSNKRWSSRFVFPFGMYALYRDLDIHGRADRVNFGRSGELLYLMICRSAHADALRPHLQKLIEGHNPWNQLLRLLQPPSDSAPVPNGQSPYLPFKRHPAFDALGEDWLRTFELNLPSFDVIGHLVTLGTLHMLLYQLQVASEWANEGQRVTMICEVVAPKKTHVRELASVSYQKNNVLTEEAVKAYINAIEASQDWITARRDATDELDAFERCRSILGNEVFWGDGQGDYEGPHLAKDLLTALREESLKGHRQHEGRVHAAYGRQIGLVSRRGTNRYRYAPNDKLLKTLLLANVAKRMELHEFLNLLFERYGLVFSDREAARVLLPAEFDKKAFGANAARLEQRLGSLGLLRRLSDACAYVENPYARKFQDSAQARGGA